MAGGARRQAERWSDFKEAAQHVPRWLAFRFLFAQRYNRHRPQHTQEGTKDRAGEIGSWLVEQLGGALMAPPPPALDRDPAWLKYVETATALGYDMQPSMMAWLVRTQWGEHSPQHRRWTRLQLLLTDMDRQQRANDAGWCARTGWPSRRA